jgi:hypothetical protein
MGNIYEEWMDVTIKKNEHEAYSNFNFSKRKKINKISYFIKNKLVKQLIARRLSAKLFLKWTNLPKEMIDNY